MAAEQSGSQPRTSPGSLARLGAMLSAGLALLAGCSKEEKANAKPASSTGAASESVTPNIMDISVNRIDGTPEPLSNYRGKVLLIVNVASKCGLTPQYKTLEELYVSKKESRFEVLGFPANDFLGQEPGSNEEIAEFCSANYGVTFPMFEKISVKGDQIHPLYARITSAPPPVGEAPSWNFTKYLVDRQGNIVARFGPRVSPTDPELVKKLDELLAGT